MNQLIENILSKWNKPFTFDDLYLKIKNKQKECTINDVEKALRVLIDSKQIQTLELLDPNTESILYWATNCNEKKSKRDIALLCHENKQLDSLLQGLKEEENLYYRDLRSQLKVYIDKLHTYNALKDSGQVLLGRLAEIEGTTTKHMYKQFDLEIDD